jgi:hypothetical protein
VDGEALRAEVVPPKGSTEPGDGIALHAVGPVMFSSAGLTPLPAGADDITISSGVKMTPQTKVLATLQGNAGNQRHILNVQTLGNDMFRVRFDGSVTGGMQVAWFVIS